MKHVFVDTSALYALMDKNDKFHRAAADTFSQFAPETTVLTCSSYVVLETVALLQSRIGMDPVKKWQSEFQPILEIVWVDADLHEKALTALIAAQQRSISLTDWTSFEIMRAIGSAGCTLQIAYGARKFGPTVKVKHPIQLLAESPQKAQAL